LFFSGGLKDGAEDTRERDGTGDAGMMQEGCVDVRMMAAEAIDEGVLLAEADDTAEK
jgi:hypothetical protein